MTTVKELATDKVYQELQNEINVNNSYSPQQNTIQKSSVNENEIKILAYESKDNSQQYLVTAPIHQVFNGTKNDFEINQIIQIKNQQITQRTTIQLERSRSMAKKKQEQVKLIILVILYLLLLPVTLIVFKLLPYIIANDTNIELSTFVTTILKHPINTFLEIIQSNYMIPFFIVQIIVLIVLFVFLHPTKRQPFEVVGKTNPVHGSAYWGKNQK